MKKLIFIIVVSAVYAACTGTTTGSKESAAPTATPSLSLPYTAAYSSKFSIGSDSNALAVLENYKAWESGDMDAFKNTLADSVAADLPDGTHFSGTKDSVVSFASRYRDNLSKIEIKMDGWIPLHSDDKNEDWVSVWYWEYDTHKDGKIDSVYYQDDNLINKDRKIMYVSGKKRGK